MTLSRRDEFAARAMVAAIESEWDGQPDIRAIVLTRIVDAQLAELDRTAPKPEPRPEIEDDGREIRCVDGSSAIVYAAPYKGENHVSVNVFLTTSNARLLFQRGLKLCDEIEGK